MATAGQAGLLPGLHLLLFSSPSSKDRQFPKIYPRPLSLLSTLGTPIHPMASSFTFVHLVPALAWHWVCEGESSPGGALWMHAQSYKKKPSQTPDWVASVWQRPVQSADPSDSMTESVIQGVRGVFVKRWWSWKTNGEMVGGKGLKRGGVFQVKGISWTKAWNCFGELQIYWLDL